MIGEPDMTQQTLSLPVASISPVADRVLVHASPEWNAPEGARRLRIRTIAVPLDGTLVAEHALPHALAIARRSGAGLRLIHAYSGLESIDMGLGLNRSDREKQNYLSEVAR